MSNLKELRKLPGGCEEVPLLAPKEARKLLRCAAEWEARGEAGRAEREGQMLSELL